MVLRHITLLNQEGKPNQIEFVDNKQVVLAMNSLMPDVYDYIELSYTGDNLTGVVYKDGGAAGTTVSTLTLAYTGDVLDSITKT